MIGVMGIDSGYGSMPKTEGGYVQFNLLTKLYQRLHDNGYVKRVFFNKKYEDGFRKFNRHLKQVLDIQPSEQDSKQASDRDRSNSHSQHKIYHDTNNNRQHQFRQDNQDQGFSSNPFEAPIASDAPGGKTEGECADYEYELEKVCFPKSDAADEQDQLRSKEALAATSNKDEQRGDSVPMTLEEIIKEPMRAILEERKNAYLKSYAEPDSNRADIGMHSDDKAEEP